MRAWGRWVVATGALAWVAVSHAAPSAPELGALRVCVADLAYPPHITLDPDRPGLAERRIVEAGKAVGVRVDLSYLPIRRCHRMVLEGEMDLVYLAATAQSLGEYRFPLTPQGQPDRALRISQEAVVVVVRRSDPVDWNGKRFASPPALGTRAGLRMAREAAERLGLSVDDSAFDAAQVLRKLQAKRHDAVLLLQADVEQQAGLMRELDLVALPKPAATFDGYMAASPKLSPAREAALKAYWKALARWKP